MLVNFFLCLVQLGFCCVYVLFVADNLYRVNELTIFLLVLVFVSFQLHTIGMWELCFDFKFS